MRRLSSFMLFELFGERALRESLKEKLRVLEP